MSPTSKERHVKARKGSDDESEAASSDESEDESSDSESNEEEWQSEHKSSTELEEEDTDFDTDEEVLSSTKWSQQQHALYVGCWDDFPHVIEFQLRSKHYTVCDQLLLTSFERRGVTRVGDR